MADFVEGFVALLVPNAGALNLSKFAKKGDIKGAKKVMKKNNVKVTDKDENGQAPLHIAMLNKKLKFATWLLDEEKADIDITDNENLYTPLHLMIVNEDYDNAIWLIRRGANWEAQAARAGETPMELVENSGNNRFLLTFQEECEKMKGKRAIDKLEQSRPKAVVTTKHVSPASITTSNTSTTNSSTATTSSMSSPVAAPAPQRTASNSGDTFTADSVRLVKAIKTYKVTCESGNGAGAAQEAQSIKSLYENYKYLLTEKINTLPAHAPLAKAKESEQVLAKGVNAYCTVGNAVANNPANDTARNKFVQVSSLLDKHFRRLIDIICKGNYNVQ
mmetsp:Transcript_2326/g.3856  ORF Transcript_2326/g.3856 Transcript_2326/m.3856 type:complete len:333 (+) Transcript_2326:74-1072(+)|eukprot:CAMPEP_0168580788 /NCGR_PEP_ID=MMETSP0420-20121227/1011_1 /TAXON_ID=498008 /ORGANISM="Pessonella sp." /LENGTH=332 /DNA_ID=CAMNT_0008614983 /DNA_START=44 /DNA_END=1042 /DNA_ORIENTATION=-